MNQRALNVLYVEDDVADADFALSALKDVCKAAVDVRIEKDGESAARRLGLDGEKPPEPHPRPHMILLDLNLPKLPGRDLLRLIKQSPRLKAIPVVVLSTSNLQKDVDEIYGLGAAGYFSKPSAYEDYKGIFKAICDYWLTHARLPKGEPRGS